MDGIPRVLYVVLDDKRDTHNIEYRDELIYPIKIMIKTNPYRY